MKKILAVLLAVVMVASLATVAFAEENVTIEVFIAQSDWADNWDVMEEKFEEEHPWIEVEHSPLVSDATTFYMERFAVNDLPDVVQLNRNSTMDELAAAGALTDLTDYECAKLMPQTYKDAYSYDGKFLGMCQGAAFSCFFYNMSILKEAGWDTQPTNWDELIQCCKDVQEKTGVAPLTVAAGKTTTSWMLFELILANWTDGFEAVPYQDGFTDGSYVFGTDARVAEKLDEIAPYFLTGTASAEETDVAAYMGDGLAAMCLAGNWNGTMIVEAIEGRGDVAAASLPPFGQPGAETWISISPEDAFCITEDPNRTAAEQEAVDTFFNWVFEAENFALIQNMRGTVPVTSNMTEEYIVLPEAVIPVVSAMGAAPGIKMGFNFWAPEFKDSANKAIQDVITNAGGAQAALDTMNTLIKDYHK